MALTFDIGYFNADIPPASALVSDMDYVAWLDARNPNGYSSYGRPMWGTDHSFPMFAQQTIDAMAARGMSLTNRPVLVVGCAYGYMVEDLRAHGVLAYGVDISSYALGMAPAAASPYMLQADVRVAGALDAAKTLAGLKGNQKFDAVLDEDVLTCLTDTDAVAACTEMRRVGSAVAHRLTIHPLEQPHDYNIKSLAAWKTLTGGTDYWFEYTTWAE